MCSKRFFVLVTISAIFICCMDISSSSDASIPSSPKIWPNISDSGSMLQFPGISGSGGLNFSIYDAFANIVNKTRHFPNMAIRHGNFTLLQLALMKAVGALAAGAATVAAEGFYFKRQHDAQLAAMSHSDTAYGIPSLSNSYSVPTPSDSYGAPPPSDSYGAPPPSNSYGAPPPSNSYGAPPPSNSYGAPPPSDSYGAPPPSNSYGAPPPSDSYGAPPPSNSYGAPTPSDSYGAPPPSNSYGAPPPSDSYGAPPPSNSYGVSSPLLRS